MMGIFSRVQKKIREVGLKNCIWGVVLREKYKKLQKKYGFTHGGTEETWKEPYHNIAQKNDIRHFVVDTVPEDGPSHFLNYRNILPKNYELID